MQAPRNEITRIHTSKLAMARSNMRMVEFLLADDATFFPDSLIWFLFYTSEITTMHEKPSWQSWEQSNATRSRQCKSWLLSGTL